MGLGVLLPTLQGCIQMFQDYKLSLLDFIVSKLFKTLLLQLRNPAWFPSALNGETVGKSGCRVHQQHCWQPIIYIVAEGPQFSETTVCFRSKRVAPIHSEPWIPSSYRSIFPFYHLKSLQYRNYTMTVKISREFKKSPPRSFYFSWFKKPQPQYDD